ncbi:MAG TPA: DUF2304 domain-containing protein [Gemmatales bacterium]|nr:DUF2304 domain-containing protein [Gemmatales bacterium]
MNLFQWIAVPFLVLLVVWEWARVARHRLPLIGPLLRTALWLLAIGLILYPDTLTYIARFLGIGVGVNLLLYLLTFTFLAVSFLLYARIVQLRRQLTQLVRHLALEHPWPPHEKEAK